MSNPPKPTKYGIAYYCVDDSNTGLLLTLEIATDHDPVTTSNLTVTTMTLHNSSNGTSIPVDAYIYIYIYIYCTAEDLISLLSLLLKPTLYS